MRRARVLGFVAWLGGCATSAVPDGDPAARTRAEIERLVSSGDVPGLQYRVVGPRAVIFESAAGVRDVTSGEPMEDATVQMAYSTTKVITAIAVMQLCDRGRMELDAPLDRYYADHPYRGVTIRQLLAHTSGVPAPMPLDWFAVDAEAFDGDEKLRGVLRDNPRLRRAPGAGYAYSNLGYWLLEKAIEAASGQKYAAYVAEHVFHPLGVPGDEARFAPDGAPAPAVGYARRLSALTLALRVMTPSRYWSGARGRWLQTARVVPDGRAYGGLWVTARALATVLQDLLADRSVLLGTEAKAAMFEPQHTSGGPSAGALGWVIGEVAGQRYFGKQGGGLGFHANVRIYPSRGIATVLVANRTEISPGPIDARSDALDVAFLTGAR